MFVEVRMKRLNAPASQLTSYVIALIAFGLARCSTRTHLLESVYRSPFGYHLVYLCHLLSAILSFCAESSEQFDPPQMYIDSSYLYEVILRATRKTQGCARTYLGESAHSELVLDPVKPVNSVA
ncbi:hypothetical protein TRVL_04114 [Trypanosoma vivax]|uniref:Uncharacterized protein n=1 Tax=Trypanosoma vivax (strain Y486) TaxID=1055687 RepID=G0TUE8_TRYVY|nr:hypothetical protein TRVL_04114 [Trypanosoma vivax]CCC47582.1 conserved hypothetical protein [Trypanosoma vivax Y486]